MNLQEMPQRPKVTSAIQFSSFVDTNIALDTLGPRTSTETEEAVDYNNNCDNNSTEAH